MKTAPEAIALLARGEVRVASLDHDLGPAEAGTGNDVLVWVEKAMAAKAWYGNLPEIHVHSANPVGRSNMLASVAAIERQWKQFRGAS